MSHISSACALLALIAMTCGTAFAQTNPGSEKPTQPVTVKLDQAQMQQMAKVMHSLHNNCFVQDMNPGDESSLVMICGVPKQTATIAP